MCRCPVSDPTTDLDQYARLMDLCVALTPEAVTALVAILEEQARARAKWGPQPHPWTPHRKCSEAQHLQECAVVLERASRHALADGATWAAILGEEAGEALREMSGTIARAEVVQVGAMALAALSECPDLVEAPRV